MVVALDGPAGVGKSTVSKRAAHPTGLHYLNSGNFYRAVTLGAAEAGVDLEDQTAVERFAGEMPLAYDRGRFMLNGRDRTEELHSDLVDGQVAQVSAFRGVRHYVNQWLRRVSSALDIVVEGRDITTVVFPDAELKVYLDASPEVRAERRFRQGTSEKSLQEIADNIRRRDEIDRGKEWGRLVRAEDAFYLDTSVLTIEEVCDRVIRKIKAKQQRIEETES